MGHLVFSPNVDFRAKQKKLSEEAHGTLEAAGGGLNYHKPLCECRVFSAFPGAIDLYTKDSHLNSAVIHHLQNMPLM